jgi:hypothetical protein
VTARDIAASTFSCERGAPNLGGLTAQGPDV